MWHGIEMERSRRNQISTIEHTMDVPVTPQVNRSHDMVKSHMIWLCSSQRTMFLIARSFRCAHEGRSKCRNYGLMHFHPSHVRGELVSRAVILLNKVRFNAWVSNDVLALVISTSSYYSISWLLDAPWLVPYTCGLHLFTWKHTYSAESSVYPLFGYSHWTLVWIKLWVSQQHFVHFY